jgi:hypothetical protein
MTAYDLLSKHIEDVRGLLVAREDILKNIHSISESCISPHHESECRYKTKLKEILVETIDELEKSRKAFKSRQLEMLRKKLIGVLAEIS